ncbi:MAG: hypothetical protein C4575_11100 [Desulforudis sp.]|jgi:chromosome segregation ATPase|nr:MAG: hypothetical protein C4575_11100 [Desulforudis sp.]
MAITVNENTIQQLLPLIRSYLNRQSGGQEIHWLDWLPLAELALANPAEWVVSFNRLDNDGRNGIISLLRDPHAGTLADSLLVALATCASEIENDQWREYVLEDAVAAHERNADRLTSLRVQAELVARQIAGAEARLLPGFDAAAEISALEKRLTLIRQEEDRLNEQFHEIHRLEREILQSDLRRRVLAQYRFDARQKYLDELQVENQNLDARKNDLENQVNVAKLSRDDAAAKVSSLEAERLALESEQADQLARLDSIQQSMDELRAKQDHTLVEIRQKEEELRHLTTEAEQAERTIREISPRIEKMRQQLSMLEVQARTAGLADLESEVSRVYAMLPDDNADLECNAPS